MAGGSWRSRKRPVKYSRGRAARNRAGRKGDEIL
jgi:hypothetical protein